MEKFRRMRQNSRAAVIAEYGLLAGLISVVAIIAVTKTGYHLTDSYDEVAITLAANLGTPVAPDIRSITQGSNSSEIVIDYADGQENYRDCQIEFDPGSGWELLESVDCQEQAGPLTLQYVSLPDPWSSVPLRLTAYGGRMVLADLGTATCSPQAPSPLSTPTIDEDCDGQLDEGERVPQVFDNPRLMNGGNSLPIAAEIADRFCATRGYAWTLDPNTPVERYFAGGNHISAITSPTSTQRRNSSEYLIRSVTCIRPDYFG